MRTWHIVVTAGLISLIAWPIARGRRMAAQRQIVHQVIDLIKDCKTKEQNSGLGVIPVNGGMPQQPADPNIYINGKVLVWDMDSDIRSPIHDMLPHNLRATLEDRPITIFMLMNKGDNVVGRYSKSAQSAYLGFTGIAVASWPDKKAIGYYSIPSTMPRSARVATARPEYGNRNAPIIAWILSLPRSAP